MRDDNEDRLLAGWSTLTPAGAGNGIDTSLVDLEMPAHQIRVGIDGRGARHLLVPVDSSGAPRDQRSGGVVLVGQELEVDGSPQLFADLVCVRPELNDIFGSLAADVCHALAHEDSDPGSVMIRALRRWRELLGPASAESTGFDLSAAIGLHGELLVLERSIDLGGTDAVGAWVGPDRFQHDFRRGPVAVEVKTTTAREGLRIEVHGLEQLDSSADITVMLVVVKLISDPAGKTLPELVDGLLARSIDAGVLLARLDAAGYQHGRTPSPARDGEWARFVPAAMSGWWVDDQFPVIRREGLPDGADAAIERLRYVLNMAAAGAPIQNDELDGVLTALAGGGS